MALERILRIFPSFRKLERNSQKLQRENERLREEVARTQQETISWRRFVPPGHFYSPLPSEEEVRDTYVRGGFGPPFGGVDLAEEQQKELLHSFVNAYARQPFPEQPQPERRFHLANNSYGHFDAIMLYCMLQHLKPRRVIEVGSGFSSAAMLDLNEHVFAGSMHLTFIDPDMQRLRALLRAGDETRVKLIERKVQDVPLEIFSELDDRDVLFIDSSHVAKIGSDVNRLYFDVLPALRRGVRVHIHDVAGNLEYPREWYAEGRAWNEQYLLRAFLMYNRAFRVELFTGLLFDRENAWFQKFMPLCARGGGGQIWLHKVE